MSRARGPLISRRRFRTYSSKLARKADCEAKRVYQLHARAQGIERISEGQPWPICDLDARDCQERSVLAQRRPAPHRAHSAGADRSDVAEAYNPAIAGAQRP